jgi:hypothetical protein
MTRANLKRWLESSKVRAENKPFTWLPFFEIFVSDECPIALSACPIRAASRFAPLWTCTYHGGVARFTRSGRGLKRQDRPDEVGQAASPASLEAGVD